MVGYQEWGWKGHFYVFSFLHVSEHSEHIYYFFAFLCLEKLIILTDGGYPPIRGKFHENNYFYFLTLPLVAIHKGVDMDLGLVSQSLCTAMEGWSLGLFIFSVS